MAYIAHFVEQSDDRLTLPGSGQYNTVADRLTSPYLGLKARRFQRSVYLALWSRLLEPNRRHGIKTRILWFVLAAPKNNVWPLIDFGPNHWNRGLWVDPQVRSENVLEVARHF